MADSAGFGTKNLAMWRFVEQAGAPVLPLGRPGHHIGADFHKKSGHHSAYYISSLENLLKYQTEVWKNSKLKSIIVNINVYIIVS